MPLLPASSSAASLFVPGHHACARHPEMRGDRTCSDCSAALCTACTGLAVHSRCPDCRVARDEAPMVVDTSWRIALLVDAFRQSVRAIPRRLPALGGIFGLSLIPAVLMILEEGRAGRTEFAAAAAMTAVVGLLLGVFLQPLMAQPLVAGTRWSRVLGGGVLASTVFFGPIFLLGILQTGLKVNDDLVGFLGMIVVGAGIPAALVLQGLVIAERPLALGGLGSFIGTFITHGLLATLWGTLMSLFLLPGILAIIIGGVGSAPLGAAIAVATGTLCSLFLLVGMGAFGAGTARYVDDLRRLRRTQLS